MALLAKNTMRATETEFLRFIEGNDKNFIIPIYQRNYDWGTKEVRQLLNDIRNITKNSLNHYFLGSVVSISERRDEICIIDGQQRLTSISLLLLAIYHLLGSSAEESNLKDRILNEYLINRYAQDHNKKIRLKLIKEDAKHFEQLFNDDRHISENTSHIAVNYAFFKKELERTDLRGIFNAIEKLVIVDIELKLGEDNPQLIFESLNSTGLALTESDKIRNFILMNERQNTQKRYYRQYWIPIEQNTCHNTSSFIRDFLIYMRGKIPNKKIFTLILRITIMRIFIIARAKMLTRQKKTF